MENFLAQVQVLLPVLNINFFEPPVKLPPSPPSGMQSPLVPNHVPMPGLPQSPVFVFSNRASNAEAESVLNKFIVRQGATVNPKAAPALGPSYIALRQQLRQEGKLVDNPQDGKWTFNQDVEFNSPSAAAAVICGFNVAGPTVWKVKGSTQTYGAWLQARVSAVSLAPDGSGTP